MKLTVFDGFVFDKRRHCRRLHRARVSATASLNYKPRTGMSNHAFGEFSIDGHDMPADRGLPGFRQTTKRISVRRRAFFGHSSKKKNDPVVDSAPQAARARPDFISFLRLCSGASSFGFLFRVKKAAVSERRSGKSPGRVAAYEKWDVSIQAPRKKGWDPGRAKPLKRMPQPNV